MHRPFVGAVLVLVFLVATIHAQRANGTFAAFAWKDGVMTELHSYGGGLVTAPETYALLLRQAMTVWLKARVDDYWTRVVRQGDRRPIEQHPQAREGLRELVRRRDPLYARAAATIDTSLLTIAQAVDRVERAVK